AHRITVLAHDTMAGRDTPSPELEEAAEYIARELRAAGMEPAGEDGTFIHRYDYTVAQLDADQTTVRVSGSGWQPTYAVDYFMVPTAEPREAPAYYVGVAGEAGPPPPEARGRILVYRHTGTELNQEWQQRLVSALQPALMLGAPGVILVLDPGFPVGMIPELARMTAEQAGPTPVVGITHEAGAELVAGLGAELSDLDGPTALGTQPLVVRSTATESTHRPPNVVAMLPGSDSVLRDTYVVLTAHFDHVGVGTPDETGDSIFNGADDDASGTAAVLEIAEALAALDEPPARSVVFLLVSGEEKGLLGSRAWVEDPTLDIGSVVANVNLDMMGRDPLPDTVIGIGQEYSTLEETLRELMAAHPELELTLILDPAPEERYFLRSDQLPFVQQRIPAVFFTTGEHEDYHQVSDEPEAIHADKAARVTRLAFYLAHAIASDPTPPEYTDEGWARIQEMLTASPF
ncbi:MAG: M20/M25/M40 family metallo-hydrolase, partial [Gemmatimonadota bacterium]